MRAARKSPSRARVRAYRRCLRHRTGHRPACPPVRLWAAGDDGEAGAAALLLCRRSRSRAELYWYGETGACVLARVHA
jgi:hypothetical protein